jgi:hypothetical protein
LGGGWEEIWRPARDGSIHTDAQRRVGCVATFPACGRPYRSYDAFREATAPQPDLAIAEHRAALHTWLNAWGCRIRYAQLGDVPLFDENLVGWWYDCIERFRRPISDWRPLRMVVGWCHVP